MLNVVQSFVYLYNVILFVVATVQCRPYRYRPRELTRLDPGQSGQWVYGLASTHDKLYVYRCPPNTDSDRLAVYSLSAGYKQLDDLHIVGLIRAWDLAADNHALYIADYTSSIVWRIVADSEQKTAEKWIQLKDVWTLSVTPAGQLVALSGLSHNSVSVYSRAGVLESQVRLSGALLNPHHAALTASRSFVVCHGDFNTDQHGVSLVSRDGAIMASYGQQPGSGPGQVKSPWHIALDAEDRVLVCDSGNRRVLLLDSKLNFLRVLLDLSSFGDDCWPRRLWFDRRATTLSVGFNTGLVVIYKLD